MRLPECSWTNIQNYFGKQSRRLKDLPLLPECPTWQWALETLDETTQTDSQRVQSFPNGGFVINNPKMDYDLFEPFISELEKFRIDEQQTIKTQIYMALSIKSNLFARHTDPGQNSLVWQCQGKTAIEIGDAVDVLEPGDVVYLHNDTPHRFTSLGPRFSVTFSLEDE